MSAEVPLDAPWTAPHAEEWDAQTLGQWTNDNISNQSARNFMLASTCAVWGADPGELSLLYALAYIRGGGNETTPGSIVRLLSTNGGIFRSATAPKMSTRKLAQSRFIAAAKSRTGLG